MLITLCVAPPHSIVFGPNNGPQVHCCNNINPPYMHITLHSHSQAQHIIPDRRLLEPHTSRNILHE